MSSPGQEKKPPAPTPTVSTNPATTGPINDNADHDPAHTGYDDYVDGPEPLTTVEENARLQAELARLSRNEYPLRGIAGGDWTFSAPDKVPSLWGEDGAVAWSEGEPLIIVGSDGSGKTVLAFNILARQLGVIPGELLGMQVEPRERVLYLAQDRPKQAARAFRRMVGTVDKRELDHRLVVIDWPLPPLEDDPAALVRYCEENEADTLYIDSLKDIVKQPADEVSGLAIRRAHSLVIASGREICILHHDRKVDKTQTRATMKLADVYGSRFITGGAGSVLALNGTSGDPIVELRQLKQPADEVGPIHVVMDFDTGGMAVNEGTDLYAVVKAANGLSAYDAAKALYGTDKPSRNDKERARRQLDRGVSKGALVCIEGATHNAPHLYYPNSETP